MKGGSFVNDDEKYRWSPVQKGGKGIVYLVGAGPGDPGLLTLKARECLEKADVVVYDNLANRVFLQYAGEGAELIYAGKEGGRHTMSQEKINGLIVEKAAAGLAVVRLKGGDPFIFGRGGEEAQELARAGVPCEIVPGVTSAIAAPAYAGIPLTHRDFTSTVAFITGHEDPRKEKSDIAWDKLSTGAGTLVFLMGMGNLSGIAGSLMQNGRSPDTPVAVIHRGTVAEQRTVVGSLRDIDERVRKEGLKPPAVILVGEVVRLREELDWFEKKPLFGRRIVVTRAREQASTFLAGLSELGAECIEFPTIEVVPPSDDRDMDEAIGALEKYRWVIFTSVNGVRFFFERLWTLGKDSRAFKAVKVAAIGSSTGNALRKRGIRPDLIPDEFRAEAVVEALRNEEVGGARILLPRAAQAREVLPEELRKMGAVVDVVETYRTVKAAGDLEGVKEMLQKGEIHMVTFTSSSTVSNFVELFREEGEAFYRWMEGPVVACIGPVTARTAEKTGLKVSLVAPEYTIESLTASIVGFFSRSTSS
ncbi:MAG: uroporphyrinogen-III C-methyltransferase [Deltaproteobacteria bacterium]|nr:uroporphyrinogen-III C-methyltransferase [Deltaproteobacteria bacterium]